MGIFRFLLAVGVVLFHSGLGGGSGPYAVFMFYILSGFVITRVINERYINYNLFAYKFYTSRLFKLFPIFIATSIITFLISIYFSHSHMFSDYVPRLPYIKASDTNLFNELISGILPEFVFKHDPLFYFFTEFEFIPQYWTIGVELVFYALAPIVFILNKNKAPFIYAYLFIFSFAYYIFSCIVTYSDYGNFLNFNYRNAFTSLFFFWWGGLIYFASLRLKFRFRARTSMLFGSLFLVAIVFSEKIIVFSNPSFNFIQWQVLILIFAIPILFSSPLNRIHQPINSFFGDLSYPLYVTHMSVVGAVFIVLAYLEKINPLLYSVFDRAITSQLTIWAWVLPLSIIVAVLAAYLIEKPVLSFRNKVLHIDQPKELEEVKFRLAHIPIYLQSFTIPSLLARASGLILIVIFITYLVSNKDASKNENIPYKVERELLISLFKGSFGDTLVDGSTIQFENESPLHRKELLNFVTKKSLYVVIAPNNKFDFKIRYSINSDFAQINIKKDSSDIEDIMVFKKEKDDRWTEVYSNEKSHFNGIILPPFFNGFYAWEGKVGSFRWASKNANILWINTEDKPKMVKMSFDMGSLISRQITVKHNRKNIENFTISPGVASAHSYSILLSPGRNTIEFVTPEPAVKPNEQDTRDLTFSIAKLKIEQ